MKTVLTAFLATAAPACHACAIPSLLPDGGFEAGKSKLTNQDHGERPPEFSNEAPMGRRALRPTGANAAKAVTNLLGHSPAVDVKAGQNYAPSLWHRFTGTLTATGRR